MAALSASALQAVKLKKTGEEARRDRSAPQYTPCEESSEKEEERRRYFFSTGLDQWYKSLKDVTIPSVFLSLTADEARAIVSCWKEHYSHKSSHEPILPESELDIPDSLQDLASRISKLVSPDKGAFVKLSTRSPKDSHIAFARAKEAYRVKLATQSSPPSGNERLILYGRIVIDSLRVRSGHDAVKLFVSSDRVGEDLEYALEPGDQGFDSRVSIVVREWVDIPLWAEFRGFVWNGKLTSIGQYNHPVVFPQLLDKREQIKSDLQAFFDNVKVKIPLDRYIIDFAWVDKDCVYLIEVNPFDGEIVFPASTGLWSWERDREQMMNGPLELRVRTEEQSDFVLKKSLDPQWRNILFS